MDDLDTKIDELDEVELKIILIRVAETLLHEAPKETDWNSDLRAALQHTFDLPGDHPSESTSVAELARASLRLACECPTLRPRISAYIEKPQPETFLTGLELTAAVAALVVLQTRVQIKRTTTGKWSLTIDKKAGGGGLLRTLAEKILGYWK